MSRTYADEYDEYIEELFQAQFDISEQIITHQLEKGQTREDFIKDEIEKRFQNINIVRGFIDVASGQSSSQSDILILKNNAQRRMLGRNVIARVTDTVMVIEVKSNATGRDIQKFCRDINLIKRQNPRCALPLFGMFCYRLDLQKTTIYKRFGYQYNSNEDLLVYDQKASLTAKSDYSGLKLDYPELDFLLSIHNEEDLGVNKFMFFRKTKDRKKKPYFVVLREKPVTKHLWAAIQGGLK